MELTKQELLNINGGGFSATLVNALSRAGSFIFKVGQSVGSSIRRVFSSNYC